MRVILLEDVKKQGKKGDIKTVKDGYGMYLINNHLAIKETEGSIDVLKKQNKEKAEKEAKKIEEAKILKEKLEKIKLTFKVKTGQNDQVFGTISTKQIANKLKDEGFNIDKKKIVLDVAVNTLGITNVKVLLHKGITANLKIELQK